MMKVNLRGSKQRRWRLKEQTMRNEISVEEVEMRDVIGCDGDDEMSVD
jgi:hypothetical protein